MSTYKGYLLFTILLLLSSCGSQRIIELAPAGCTVSVPSDYRLITSSGGDRYTNGEGSSISISSFIKPLPTREVPGGKISTRLIESRSVAVYEAIQLRYSNGVSSTMIQMTDGTTQIFFAGEAARTWRTLVHGCGLRTDDPAKPE